ncbi:hypothetical protein [Luteimonas huabeiensis]|uniref:hypothetical protein n=1 Tax=Luteimonas huabeiensis TaxID=1244513 RepID=UPI0004651BD4|nr:hypothetical protein [Luteimonas huabeiensis]
MPSPFENLAGPGGPLSAELPDEAEIAGLLRSGRVRLADAGNATLSLESRFDLAYNGAHALCLAALRMRGYRARHRYIVFQVLPHTLGLGPEVWRVLAKAHDVRNLAEYEGHIEVSERLVLDILQAGDQVASALP